jgi:hypothetical protein
MYITPSHSISHNAYIDANVILDAALEKFPKNTVELVDVARSQSQSCSQSHYTHMQFFAQEQAGMQSKALVEISFANIGLSN